MAAAVLASSLSSAADLTLMSWNTMRLGQGGEKSFPALAEVAGKADLVVLVKFCRTPITVITPPAAP